MGCGVAMRFEGMWQLGAFAPMPHSPPIASLGGLCPCIAKRCNTARAARPTRGELCVHTKGLTVAGLTGVRRSAERGRSQARSLHPIGLTEVRGFAGRMHGRMQAEQSDARASPVHCFAMQPQSKQIIAGGRVSSMANEGPACFVI